MSGIGGAAPDSLDALRAALLERRGLDLSIMSTPGVTIVAEDARVDTRIASGYVFGRHFTIFTDPAYADRFDGFVLDGDADALGDAALDAFVERAEQVGATNSGSLLLGRGAMRALTSVPSAERAEPAGMVAMDREDPADVARIQALVDACDEDEVDDAAIEMDELDPEIRCVESEPGGRLTGYASAFPDPDFGGRWDIGVLTHPDHRRKGLGVATVRRLTLDLLAIDELPIYRHDLDNTGSAAVSAALGFDVATILAAVRFPETD